MTADNQIITYKITCNGSWGFNIKTPFTDRKVRIGYNSDGYQDEKQARKSCKDITDLYERKGFTIKEITQ